MSKNNFITSFPVFLRLVKYQLSLMVTFSAMTGYFLTGRSIGFKSLILFIGVLFLAAGSAGLNQYQERKQDALMDRTKKRPVPANQIHPFAALIIALVLIIAGALFLANTGWIPMVLGLSNVVLYNLIYTPLKRLTWLAIIPGAFVGAIAPLIGWTSAGSSIFHPVILFVAGFVLLWQMPHFWLLLIRFRKDYEMAGFSSLPRFMNDSRIKNLVFIWAVLTSFFILSFPLFGISFKPPVITLFVILNLLFIFLFYRFLFGKKINQSLRNAFILINSFALIVFLVLIFGTL